MSNTDNESDYHFYHDLKPEVGGGDPMPDGILTTLGI